MLSFVFLSLVSGPIQEPKPVEVIDLGEVKGYPRLIPTAVSDKGDVAVGWANRDDPKYEFVSWVWTSERGMTALPGSPTYSINWTLTGDGKFYAANSHIPPNGPYVFYGLSSNPRSTAFIRGGLVSGGGFNWQTGLKFSGNGQYLLGHSIKNGNLMLYTMKDGSTFTLPKPPSSSGFDVGGISRDGSRVLIKGGYSDLSYLWDRSKPGVTHPIRIIGANSFYEVNALSDDGKYVAGWGYFSNGRSAFRWSEAKGVEFAPPNKIGSLFQALVINGDGSVVGGMSQGDDGYSQASVWTDKLGRRTIKSLLRPGEMENPKIIFDLISDVNPAGTTFLLRGYELVNNVYQYHVYIVKFASKQVMESR